MMAFSPENKNDWFLNILELLRYGVFVAFYILSVRVVFVSLCHATPMVSIIGGMAAVAIAILSWRKVLWALYAFVIGIPLVSGLQIIGFMQAMPLLSIGFASIYLAWLPKRVLWNKENITPRTGVGSLIDVLSAIVLLSLIMAFWPYPLDFALYRFWLVSFFGQNDQFWGIEASYILLQGLFFYRLMELEINDHRVWRKIIPILYIQASIIILFSLLQLVFHTPRLHYTSFGVYSPFNDIHSYGSYVIVLFFIFLSFTCTKGRIYKLGMPFMVFFFVFIVLSGCNGTWLAMLITGSAFLAYKLRVRQFIVLISLMLIGLLYVNLVPSTILKSNYPWIRRYARSMIIKNPPRVLKSRFDLWDRAYGIMKEFPITGSGIGTFYRISSFYHDPNSKKRANWYENAHNYYLQLGADLGILGLLLFLGILFCTYKAGFHVVSRSRYGESKNLIMGLLFGLSAYLITMLSSHPLLLSNQQFLFWFVIAAIAIAYHLSGGGTLFNRSACHSKVLIGLLAGLIVVGYGYKLGVTDMGPQGYEYGFYHYENWGGEKTRWTMKMAGSRVAAKGSLLAFDVFASPHNIGPQGLNLKVFLNGKLRDEVNFLVSEWKHLNYYIPSRKNEMVEVKTVVSKTFNPYRLCLSKDNRELGVAVGEIEFLDEMPKDGVGFYDWETWGGGQIPGWPNKLAKSSKLKAQSKKGNSYAKNLQVRFRWTGMRASINLEGEFRAGVRLFLMCAHPGIDKDPVRVEIIGDDGVIREETFADDGWKRVLLRVDELKGSKVLTIQVSRTWNPKLAGISEDSRDLGVAVAVLKEKLLVNRPSEIREAVSVDNFTG